MGDFADQGRSRFSTPLHVSKHGGSERGASDRSSSAGFARPPARCGYPWVHGAALRSGFQRGAVAHGLGCGRVRESRQRAGVQGGQKRGLRHRPLVTRTGGTTPIATAALSRRSFRRILIAGKQMTSPTLTSEVKSAETRRSAPERKLGPSLHPPGATSAYGNQALLRMRAHAARESGGGNSKATVQRQVQRQADRAASPVLTPAFPCDRGAGIELCNFTTDSATAPNYMDCLQRGKDVIDACKGEPRDCLAQSKCATCACMGERYCQCTGII